MLIAAVALILPTVLFSTVTAGAKILSFSRATTAVLLVIYIVYLYFQMKTHKDVFMEEKDDVDHDAYGHGPEAHAGGNAGPQVQQGGDGEGEAADDEDETPSMRKVYIATVVLVVSGVAIGKCTHNFIESLDGMTQTLGITKTFVAIILIPMASNAPEMSQVVAASRKKKINFAIGVIVGSILQIALFVLPILVVIGWLMDREMNLNFEPSQSYILLLAVMIVNQVLQDGQYTYLHGVMLLTM
jgi:Ca2+:H+ antiporter